MRASAARACGADDVLSWLKRYFRAPYAAASTPPGRAPWMPPRSGATEALGPALDIVAARARDAVRNNPYAARIVDVWVANLVGTGITTMWPDSHAQVWRAWAESVECDVQRHHDWYGVQALATRCLVESGEALVRLVNVEPSERNPVGLELLTLEADVLASEQHGVINGRRVVQGVEIDAVGRPIGYWLRTDAHGRYERVDAQDMCHLFRRRRPDQYRDVSWLAPVLWSLRDLATYEAALVQKAKIEAALAAIVIDDQLEPLAGQSQDGIEPVRDMHGRPVEDIQSGTILYRRGGSIEQIQPTGGGSHQGYARRTLEAAAVGVGLTYDQVSGDLTQANYSSLRAGKIEHRRLLEQVQYTTLVPALVDRVAKRFHANGVLLGLWDDSRPRITHTAPPPEMIDPIKDTLALLTQMRAGMVSPQAAAAYFGYDWAEVARDMARAQALWDELGLVFDSDARRVSKQGTAHDASQIAAVEIAATGAASGEE